MFNVVRTYPGPASLERRRSYREADVVLELKNIFFDKCYLCEMSEPTSLNVEHFDSHQGDDDKKYDWDNLYFVCARCNNIKLSKYNELLDCTDPNIDVFKLIKHLPPSTPYQKKVVIKAMDESRKVIETTKLLNEIFNTSNTINKEITGVYLRKNVFKRFNRLLELINKYFDNELSQPNKNEALERLQVLMGKEQEFSAFMRWIILEDETLEPLLQSYMD